MDIPMENFNAGFIQKTGCLKRPKMLESFFKYNILVINVQVNCYIIMARPQSVVTQERSEFNNVSRNNDKNNIIGCT